MHTNRREFAGGAAALAVGLAAGTGPALATATKTSTPARLDPNAWHQRIKRIVQVNFNERDPESFDVDRWADYLAATEAQATFLSVTNIVAFYPTALPDLPVSRYLNGRDLFGECVAALRKRGIRILGRLSIDVAEIGLAEGRPEWFRRNANGSLVVRGLVGGPGDPASSREHAATCQFSTYYSEFVPALINEVLSRYAIDGIYSNGWPGVDAPVCYCRACRAIGEPGSEAYKQAYQRRAVELWRLYSDLVSRRGSAAIFSGNLGGGFRGGDLDLTELTAQAPWFLADNQGRGGVGAPTWDASQQTRIAKAIVGSKPVPNSTGSYQIAGDNRWRNVTGNPDEVRSRLFQTAAAGGVLYYHWLGYQQGFVEDRRWQEVGREVFAWQAKHDRHFHNLASLAEVAMVVSQRSNRLYKPPVGTETLDAVQGMYQLLTEARIPFDVVLDNALSADALKSYRVLVLANAALLSDAQAAQIEAFVGRGGSLLTTFETGLYDEAGKPRADFALARLFSMRRTGPRESFGIAASAPGGPFPGSSATQRLGRPHPLTASFRDTNWIQGSSARVPIAAEGTAILTHVPRYPWYPTEAVFPREPRTDSPTVVARERGRSRIAHLAGDVEAGYWRTGAGDLGDLVTNALQWINGDGGAFQVEGEGLVETFGWRTEPGYAVHLVNFTNPNFRAAALRRAHRVGPQTVSMRVPASFQVTEARLLRSERSVPVRRTAKGIEFVVPDLVDYEVAALEARA